MGLNAVASVEMDSDLFAVLDSDQMASIDPDVVATIDSAGAMAINSARVELVSWDVAWELTADSDGIPALDSDRTAGFDSDRMAAFSTGGVQAMDAHVNAGIDLDVVMAIALGLVEDSSKAAAAADSDGLMRIDSVVARQDVEMVVSPDVTVETAFNVQILTYSDGMVAIESEVMAMMGSVTVMMRNPG